MLAELTSHAKTPRGIFEVSRQRVGEESFAQLEQPDTLRAERLVAGRGVEHPWKHAHPKFAALGAQGVLQLDGRLVETEILRPALGAERVGDGLGEADIREQPSEQARRVLLLCEPPWLGYGRQRLRHPV